MSASLENGVGRNACAVQDNGSGGRRAAGLEQGQEAKGRRVAGSRAAKKADQVGVAA